MALTELRNQQNTWFQKRNHVRAAKNQLSKKYIDPALGTSGGGVTPPVETDVMLHFIADASTMTIENTNEISEWRDQSGNAFHATQSVSLNRPLWDGTAVLNGGLDGLEATRGFDLPSATPDAVKTLFMVCEMAFLIPASSLGGYQDMVGCTSTSGAGITRFTWHGQSAATNFYSTPFSDATANDTALLTANVNGTYLADVIAANERFVLTAWGQNGTNTANPDHLLNRLSMDRGLLGQVYEIIMYSVELTAQQRAETLAYLKAKWSIT